MSTTVADPSIIEPAEFLGEEFRHNPFPLYQRIREYDPVYNDRFQNRWIISRYEHIWSLYKDKENVTRGVYEIGGKFKFGSDTPLGPTILDLGESDAHRQQRGLVAGEFAGKKLEAWLPGIENIARDMIDAFSVKAAEDLAAGLHKRGHVDLVRQFSQRFPVRVIAGMLGLPVEDNDYFERIYGTLFGGMGYGRAAFKMGVDAREELFRYLDPVIADRRANPRDDLISKFCTAEFEGTRMSDEQIKAFIALLLVGGGDTTHKAIDMMWWGLLRHPEQYVEVRRHPELMDRVFTEMLRYDGSNHWQRRRTTREIEVGGKVIPMGASVWLGLGSGNRDERVFKDPDEFNIFRDDLYFGKELRTGHWQDGVASHLGFGMETHFCLGYAMARQEAVIASTILMDVLKNPRIVDLESHEGPVWPPPGVGGVRGLMQLAIEYDI
ncbi:MAG: cytochrome P450 [Dehalococcoidia bacterium]